MSEGAVIVGGGPAGLAAAVELRELGAPVTVIEREREAGGIPRHSEHTGFGTRDLRRVMSGPRYAKRYRQLSAEAGVEVLTETMVTEWGEGRRLSLTGPNGRREIEPAAVLLATGCRERPRSARLIPGSRGAGVMTTGTLQQRVHLHGEKDIGERALVVGAEHVSFSAVATLAEGGARAVGLVTELPRHQSLGAFKLGAAVRYRAPVWTRTAVTEIRGHPRVSEVELTDLDSGEARTVECDLVVFTADWIPDFELAAMAGCELDPGTLGPRVDTAMRTTAPGVFAAGNLVHPAETADLCALHGRHAALTIAPYLWHLRAVAGSENVSIGWPGHLPIRVTPPLRWVFPNQLEVSPAGVPDAPRGRFVLRAGTRIRAPRVEVSQGERRLWSGRLRLLTPGRPAHIPDRWTKDVDPEGSPVTVAVK